MRAVRLALLILVVLGSLWRPAEGEILKTTMVLMPFKDETGFRGAWDIEREVPTYLGKILSENPFFAVVPMDSVYKTFKGQRVPKDPLALSKMGQALGADLVLTGVINDFNVSRFGVGAQMLGGYRSYSAQVDVKVALTRVLDAKSLARITGQGEVTDRAAAVTILGKPTARDSEFFGLDSIRFGSERFKETIIGEACLRAFEQVKANIEEVVRRPRQVVGQVLMVADGQAVYLNIGIGDGLEVGDKLGVYEQGEELTDPQTGEVVGRADDRRIGSIQITELKAEHFSKARVLEGQEVVAADHLVKTQLAETEED